jgi:spermidine synthase
MTSEKDEFFYHENLVHMAALAHPRPRHALIVGGGDGGSAEELLKHRSIEHVTLAEIDASVVDISRKYLTNVHHGSLDDPRVDLKIEDGFAFVRNTREQFDLIVLDLTDPGGPSTPLYTVDFYRACAARLLPGGALTLHIASPIAHPDRIRTGLSTLREAFAVVRPYLASIPLYGGLWMMACCAATLDPATLAASKSIGASRNAVFAICSTTTARSIARRSHFPISFDRWSADFRSAASLSWQVVNLHDERSSTSAARTLMAV